MHRSLEILMDEHRVIEGVLSSLITFVNSLKEGDEAGRKTVGRYVDFFRNFADGCHHCKEEDLLFQKMVEFNFPSEFGPLAVMDEEHKQARKLVGLLAGSVERTGSMSHSEIMELRETSTAYASLLSGHIMKEDNVLYPMAQQALPQGDVLDAMLSLYSSFEEKAVGKKGVERLRGLAESLMKEYPPDQCNIPVAGCAGCSGH